MTIAEIVDVLKADVELSAMVSGRIYDHDIRRTGWEAVPEAFDEWGQIRPVLCVDDGGSIREPFGGPGSVAGTVYILAIGPRTAAARAIVATAMTRVQVLLFRWQAADGTTLFPATRLGRQEDEDGVWDRVEMKAAGVLPVAW